MLIANPIYDVVFKYLLEDNKIAKLFLGAIIGEKIDKLDFRPQEYSVTLENKKSKKLKNLSPNLTVYRLDFSAKIRNSNGTFRLATIELQKAKFSTDIMRFRGYLGGQYALKENTYRVRVPDKKDPTKYKLVQKAIPIVPIYFLGHRLDLEEGHPIVKVARQYVDNTTGQVIKGKDDFIEGLTHDSFVIQIQDLPTRRRNELEMLLSIFDQTNHTQDYHILNVNEADIPEKYRPIVRRLQAAVEEPEVRKLMVAEDEFIEELEYKDREIAEQQEVINLQEQALVEKNKTIEDQAREIEELRKQLTRK